MALVVTDTGLQTLLARLRDQGRVVIGPTVRDGVISHAEIDTIDDLPRGWAETEAPGSYRLRATGGTELFGFSTPSESWKRFVFPPKSLLIRGRAEAGGIRVEEAEPDVTALAFFGVRSCDLAALGVLDRVFSPPGSRDPEHAARTRDLFIVAAACASPSSTCFCASMDTGPTPRTGYDLTVTELVERSQPRYLIESGSDQGAALLADLPGRPVAPADRAAAAAQHDGAVASMTRRIDPHDPPQAATDPEHPRWAAVAERCLACGNCTLVCPTCFCSRTEDTTSLDGTETERHRVWDSCFTLDFTHMHGGSTRSSVSSRYRQWLLHKLVTWHDQFGTSGCVGCGRCITWCPVGIDLTEEIAALASRQTEVVT